MQRRWTPATRTLTGLALVGLLGCTPPPVNAPPGSGGSAENGGGSAAPSGPIGTLPPAQSGSGTGSPSQSPSQGTAPSANNNCGVKKIDLEKRPADLLLVLDRSRSMVQNAMGGGGGRGSADGGTTGADGGVAAPAKWTEVVAAIDPVIERTQSKVAWGLKLFPVSDQCGVPDGATIPMGLGNHAQVMTAIRGADPAQGNAGGTPTRLAVEKASAFMKSATSANAKYLVLATDGQPNCAEGGRNNNDDATGAIRAITNAAENGIATFVVGVATAGSEAHETLNAMAEKGGRARADATKYFPVASRDELVATLETITGQIASCTFPLDTLPPTPDNVAVEVDGARIARDQSQAQGWNYGPANRSVVFHGELCEKLKSGAAKNVQILYGCPGVTIN